MRLLAKGLPLLLILQLWSTLSNYTFAQNTGSCHVDASIAHINYNKNFTYCNYNNSGSLVSVRFDFENTSTTKATNTSYRIDWGDGKSDTYGKEFEKVSHIYATNTARSYEMVLTVTGENGCEKVERQKVFIGSNPNVLVDVGGNSFSCAPATYDIKVSRFEDNPPNTIYTFTINDGTATFTRTHQELLANPIVKHTFTEASPSGGFSVTCRASNDCSFSENSWRGIRVTEGPKAAIGVSKTSSCVNQKIVLKDKTTDGYDGYGGTMPHVAEWDIIPATGWNIQYGQGEVSIVFSQPGVYTVKLTASPEDPNTTCRGSSADKVFTILAPPVADFSISPEPATGCISNTVNITNTTIGESLSYNWVVTNAQGQPVSNWGTIVGGATAKEPQFGFTKPGEYLISLTASNGCSPSIKKLPVTIKGTPIVTLPAAQVYCDAQVVDFSAANHKPVYDANFGTITGYKWEVKIVSGQGDFAFDKGTSSSSQYPSIHLKKPAVYEVSAYAINECGETSAPAKQTITINALPELTASSPKAAICIGESTTINVVGADNYTWAPAEGLSTTTGSTVTVNPKFTTTYTVTGKNNTTGCSNMTTFTVVVNPLPEVKVTSDAASICFGQGSATLMASGADTYTWFPAEGLSATSGAAVGATPAKTTTYTVTGTNTETGCSSTATVTVVVNPLPAVSAGEDLTLCNTPVPTKLKASPAGGVWSGAHVTTDGTFTPPTELGQYELIYTYTDALGCTVSDILVINVTETPVANAGEDRAVCLNSAAFQLAALPAGGTWSGSALVSADGAFTPSAIGTHTLIYTYGTGSCQTSDEVKITVNALPSAPRANGVTICPGTTATLSVISPQGSIGWYTAATGGQLLSEEAEFTTTALTATTSYYVQSTVDGGCTSTRRAVKVTVRPATPAPVVTPVILCGPRNKATLTAQGNAAQYEWYTSESEVTPVATGKTFETEALDATRTYYVEAITDGCISPRVAVTVTVNPLISQNSITPVATICSGQTPDQLIGSKPEGGDGNYTYTWESSTEDAETGFTVITGATAENFRPGALSTTTWYRRTVKSAICTDVSAPLQVTVTPVISNNTIKGDAEICEGSAPSALTGSEPEGGNDSYTYAWESSLTGDPADFRAAAGKNDEQHYTSVNLNQTTWFRRKVTSGSCQEDVSALVKITVYKPISSNTISEEQTVCAGAIPAVLTGSQPEGGNKNYVYTWEMSSDGSNFEPATLGRSLLNGINFAPAALSKPMWFRRVVSGGPCEASKSNAVLITVNQPITNYNITSDQVICSGVTPEPIRSLETVGGGDGTYTYRWLASTTGANGNFEAAEGINNLETYTPEALTKTVWYKREVASGGCVSVSNVIEVTVVQLPAAPTVQPVTICENTTATLLVEEAGDFAWYTQAQGGTAVFRGRSFTTEALEATTTFYVESINSNGCGSPMRAAVTVTVQKNLSNNSLIAPQGIICAGQSPAILTGSAPEGGSGSFTYRWESKAKVAATDFQVINGATQATYQPGPLSETTLFRRVAMSGPCAELTSEAVEITVVPVISNNVIKAAQTLCEGDVPATLEGGAPAGGDGNYAIVWESRTEGMAFAPAPGKNDALNYTAPAGLSKTTWYRRVVKSGPCAQDVSAEVKVTVQPAIQQNTLTSKAATICSGEAPAVFTATQPTGGDNTYKYVWEISVDGGQTFSNAPGTYTNSSYASPALTQNTLFRRKVTSDACSSFSDVVLITVNDPIIENSIKESQVICVDTAPSTITGSDPKGGTGSYTYVWEYATGGANGTYKAVAQSGTGKDLKPGELGVTTWYRRVVTSGACTHISNVVEITVNPAIQKNTIMAPQTIYSGQVPAGLTGSTPIGGDEKYTYLWEYSEDGKNFAPAATPNTGKNYSPKALTKDTWFRRVVYSGGCESFSNVVKITVTPAIGNNNIQADQIICFGNVPATLVGSIPKGGEGAYTYLWQQSTSGPTTGWRTADGSKNNEANFTPQALTQDTWFRRTVISDINTDESNVVMIQVKPAMSNNKISTSQTICYNTAPSALTGTQPNGGSGNYTYLWEMSTSGPTSGWTIAPGDNNRKDYVSNPLVKTTWFRRVVTSESCDGLVSEPIKVTVTPLPEMPLAQGATICAGQSTKLTATGKGGRLEWFASAAGGTPIAVGSTLTTPVLQHTTTYYVQEMSQSCASERQPVIVKVAEPQVSAGPDITIVKGRSAQLAASGGVSYKWTPAAGMEDATMPNPTVSPEVTTVYTVTAVTEGGCTFSDEVVVTVLPYVDIPNTFTPNSDGINDTWEIENISKYQNCKVQVFNQWGNLVFTSDGYKAPWDGRHNGSPLPMATYYYIIKLDQNEKPLTGSITIVK
ncbi:Ig-like domain-containing protein [Pontibacter rugosus]|uniref:Gliding motility-associated C-terminal domain-containing protein n=1 Tax=Pontibacter rugosus TaxID=1745966 RepID=A0ABW3ST25_9BACT